MTKSKRVKAIILAFVMIFTVLFASLFIIFDTAHDCAIENCQVCQIIQSCLEHLKITGKTENAMLSLCALMFLFILIILSEFTGDNKTTLVSLKIKLSD